MGQGQVGDPVGNLCARGVKAKAGVDHHEIIVHRAGHSHLAASRANVAAGAGPTAVTSAEINMYMS